MLFYLGLSCGYKISEIQQLTEIEHDEMILMSSDLVDLNMSECWFAAKKQHFNQSIISNY